MLTTDIEDPVIRNAAHDASRCGICRRTIGAREPITRQLIRCRRTNNLRRPCWTFAAVCTNCSKIYYRKDLPKCYGCGRKLKIEGSRRKAPYCSEVCRVRYWSNHRAECRKARREKTCAVCGQSFEPSRADAIVCSAACRQKRYRQKET